MVDSNLTKKSRLLFIGPCDRGGISTVNRHVLHLVEMDGKFDCRLLNTTPWRETRLTPWRGVNKLTGYLVLYGISLWTILRFRPRCVYLQISQTGFFHQSIFLLLAKVAACRTIAHLHSMPCPSRAMGASEFRRLLRSQGYIDELIVLADEAKADLQKHGWRKRLHVIPNFVDAAPYPGEVTPLSQREYVLFLGRMDERKGIYKLLEIAKQIPDEHFLFIGGFSQKNAQNAFLTEASKLANVTWKGPIYGDAKIPWLARAKCLVLPSDSEVFPMTLIESSLCGTIPLATPVGLIPAIIESGVGGLLIDANATSQVVESIRDLLSDPVLYEQMARRCQAKSRSHYSQAVVGPRLLRVLDGDKFAKTTESGHAN